MTKYILHGGNAQKPCAENDIFFGEILKSYTSNPKILLVHFAGKPEKAIINKERDTNQFNRIKENKDLKFEIANEISFVKQIKKNDIIYLGGGTTVKILESLRKFHGLKKLFEGKVVAGESAGANALSTYCYSKSGGGIIQSLGILPVNVVPHYEKSLNKVFDSLNDSNLEKVFLPEYKFRIFEV